MNRAALFASVVLGLVACDGGSAKADDPKPSTEKAATNAAPSSDQNYTVRIVPGEAKAGQPATSVVEVLPGAGYKINLEFPVRMTLSPLKGAKAAKRELSKADAEISEKALRFNVVFTADAAGTLSLDGAADFSVCNPSTCKLIRDEKLSWEVAVK